MWIQVEIPTGIEKQARTQTHTHTSLFEYPQPSSDLLFLIFLKSKIPDASLIKSAKEDKIHVPNTQFIKMQFKILISAITFFP